MTSEGLAVEDMNGNTSNQYLTFVLADEVYGVSVANIKEVLVVPRITRVPRMPAFMNGVINLRGNVVPVLDLRMKFGLGKTVSSKDTSIIVTEITNIFEDDGEGRFTIGIFSDIVLKVVTLESNQILPPPKIGGAVDADFITGMGRDNGDFIIILDLTKLLSERELLTAAMTEESLNE
jgi:purine-binding chemotaxis protein CheW